MRIALKRRLLCLAFSAISYEVYHILENHRGLSSLEEDKKETQKPAFPAGALTTRNSSIPAAALTTRSSSTSQTQGAAWALLEKPPQPRPQKERLVYIGVLSAPTHQRIRHRARAAWITALRHKSPRAGMPEVWAEFIIGHLPFAKNMGSSQLASPCQVAVENDLEEESRLYQDIRRIPLAETYSRLPDKTLLTLAIGVELGYKFVVKLDDDWLPNTRILAHRVKPINPKDLVFGGNYMWHTAKYTFQRGADKGFEPYFSGRSYFASWELAWRIAKANMSLSAEYHRYGCSSEDVDMGRWVSHENATHTKIIHVEYTASMNDKEPPDRSIRIVGRPDLCLTVGNSEARKTHSVLVVQQCLHDLDRKHMRSQRLDLLGDGKMVLESTPEEKKQGMPSKCVGTKPDDKQLRLQVDVCDRANNWKIRHFVECGDGTIRLRSAPQLCVSADMQPAGKVVVSQCGAAKDMHSQIFDNRNVSAKNLTPAERAFHKSNNKLKCKRDDMEDAPRELGDARHCPPITSLWRWKASKSRTTGEWLGPVRDRLLYIGVMSSFKDKPASRASWRSKFKLAVGEELSHRVKMEFVVGHGDFKKMAQGSLTPQDNLKREVLLASERAAYEDVWRVPTSDQHETVADKFLLLLARAVELGYCFVVATDTLQRVDVAVTTGFVRARSPRHLVYAGDVLCEQGASGCQRGVGERSVRYFTNGSSLLSWELAHGIAVANRSRSSAFAQYGSASEKLNLGYWVDLEAAARGAIVEYVQIPISWPLDGSRRPP